MATLLGAAASILSAAAAATFSNGMTFTLGDLVLSDVMMEVPEKLQNGSKVALAQHDFAGAIRSQQTFGLFPDSITWQARFTGTYAIQRRQQMDRIIAAQQPIVLSIADKAWLGTLAEFVPVFRHQWLIEYRARFEPLQDISGGAQAGEDDDEGADDEMGDVTGSMDDSLDDSDQSSDVYVQSPQTATAPAAATHYSATSTRPLPVPPVPPPALGIGASDFVG